MKRFLSFVGVLMALCVFKISTDISEPQSKYIEEDLFVDDLETFEEIVLGQAEGNKTHITELYEPNREDLTIIEIPQIFLAYTFPFEKISFKTPAIFVNNFTLYKTIFYKNHLHSITPPPPQA